MVAYSVTRKATETLSSVQAANANCASFAFTFFASSTENPQSYGFHITVLSTNLLIALSKPSHPHQKYIATFVFASRILGSSIYFWWRWRESNPRPEHLSLCFKQQFYKKIKITKATITNPIKNLDKSSFTWIPFILNLYNIVKNYLVV